MKPSDSFESCHTDSLSARITVQTAARRELTRADGFGRPREALCATTRQSEGFSIYTSPFLPWIYCSNTHCTMVLWQKCGIFTFNLITGVMVYNYIMHVWLRQL